ncbi:MAG TPA: DUF1456 family protein [Nanoarchaeota archaeon]|nr:DUF1456 family protein [Nanoarchaeota archaeon]
MKLGLISDVHHSPEHVARGIQKLRGLGVERLILNGDIGEAGELEESQAFSAQILEAVGQSGLESYVQPGSHETLSGYGVIVDLLSQKYGNIIDMTRESAIDIAGHRLLFLPGSDAHSGGEYHVGKDISSGRYALTENGVVHIDSFQTLQILLHDKKVQGMIQYKNIQDLVSLVENPERSIALCHVPALFPIGQRGVDFAYFATNAEAGFIPGYVLERQIHDLVVKKEGREVSREELDNIARQNGYTFHKKNVGNKELRQFLDQLGIRYAVNGHTHESGHHAHDRNGQSVPEYVPASELFWNSGCFDQGQMGILSVDTKGVSYQNVRL